MQNRPNEIYEIKVENVGFIETPTLKSLFIEMYFEETLLSSGTAFLVAKDKESHCCLITNRHNVTGRHQDTDQCLSPTAAIPSHIQIYFHRNDAIGEWLKIRLPLYRDDATPYWFEHSQLGPKVDVVALNLHWGSDVAKVPYYLSSGLDRDEIFTSPSETVSVIGFPFGLSTAGRFPVWATGFLAQDLSLMSADNPCFLIDCRTRQGQSGSAVIAYRPNGYRQLKDGVIQTTMMGATKWEFLGIYSGRINGESDLGRVWHVSTIEDLYETAALDQKTRQERADAKKVEG